MIRGSGRQAGTKTGQKKKTKNRKKKSKKEGRTASASGGAAGQKGEEKPPQQNLMQPGPEPEPEPKFEPEPEPEPESELSSAPAEQHTTAAAPEQEGACEVAAWLRARPPLHWIALYTPLCAVLARILPLYWLRRHIIYRIFENYARLSAD